MVFWDTYRQQRTSPGDQSEAANSQLSQVNPESGESVLPDKMEARQLLQL